MVQAAPVTVAASDTLELALSRALRQARTAWPDVTLDDAAFVTTLAQRLTVDGAVTEQLAELNLVDLFLATACVAGDAAALRVVSEDLLTEVGRSLGRIHGAQSLRGDVEQTLREKLLVGEVPRLSAYDGKGPLVNWLRTIAVRDALKARHARERHHQVEAQVLAEATPLVDVELDLIRQLHRDDFKAAFDASFRALERRQRNVLRMHVLDGLSIDQIGAFYRTHRTTAFRWLDAAREELSRGIRRELGQRLRLSAPELDSLMGLVRSHLDFSLERLLVISAS